MPGQKGFLLPPKSSLNMGEEERAQWRQRAKWGDVYELEGYFPGHKVYLPKVIGDNPTRTRLWNEQRFEYLRRYIEKEKKRQKGLMQQLAMLDINVDWPTLLLYTSGHYG